MDRVLVHPLAGVLSAYGMGLADQAVLRESALERVLDGATLSELQVRLQSLGEEALAELRRQGTTGSALHTLNRVHLRYEGTDTASTTSRRPCIRNAKRCRYAASKARVSAATLPSP